MSILTPVLQFQTRDTGKLSGIGRDQRQIISHCLRGNPKVVSSDHSAAVEQPRPKLPVNVRALFIGPYSWPALQQKVIHPLRKFGVA